MIHQAHKASLLFLYYPRAIDNDGHEYMVESLAHALLALIFAYRIDLRATDVQHALTLLRAGELQRHGPFLAVELPAAPWGEHEAPDGLTYLPADVQVPAKHNLALQALLAAERYLDGVELSMKREEILFQCAQFQLDGYVWQFAPAGCERGLARGLGAPALR